MTSTPITRLEKIIDGLHLSKAKEIQEMQEHNVPQADIDDTEDRYALMITQLEYKYKSYTGKYYKMEGTI
jgi:hypothetical protein